MRENLRVKTHLTSSPEQAAEFVRKGGVVAFPTETVYGLGADVFDENAVKKIFEAKMRPADNPLIAHISEHSQLRQLALEVTGPAQKLIDAFFPGPLTVVLKKTGAVPTIATAGLETIGVRMPKSATAHEFLQACSTPVVAPSANLSGRPSPTTWEAVFEDLDGRIDCILQDDQTVIGLESTVVDCTSDVPLVLRLGAISLEEIRSILPDAELYQDTGSDAVRSPGLRHSHYSPRARVYLTDSLSLKQAPHDSAFIGINAPEGEFRLKRICESVAWYAHDVFEFFRECDRAGIANIYCEIIPESGIGAALMDRLRRAAE